MVSGSSRAMLTPSLESKRTNGKTSHFGWFFCFTCEAKARVALPGVLTGPLRYNSPTHAGRRTAYARKHPPIPQASSGLVRD